MLRFFLIFPNMHEDCKYFRDWRKKRELARQEENSGLAFSQVVLEVGRQVKDEFEPVHDVECVAGGVGGVLPDQDLTKHLIGLLFGVDHRLFHLGNQVLCLLPRSLRLLLVLPLDGFQRVQLLNDAANVGLDERQLVGL